MNTPYANVESDCLQVKTFEQLNTQEIYEILKSRSEIFMLGQGISCLDMDDLDYNSLHCFYMNHHRVIAYLRAFYTDESHSIVRISRVLTLEHGKGMGRQLMENSISAIKTHMNVQKITVDAQKSAVGFYQKMGFHIASGEFLEAGVVHIKMDL